MAHSFDFVYRRIAKHGEIVDFEENSFILWNNETGTCQRLATFDENGCFIENQLVARIKRA